MSFELLNLGLYTAESADSENVRRAKPDRTLHPCQEDETLRGRPASCLAGWRSLFTICAATQSFCIIDPPAFTARGELTDFGTQPEILKS